MAMMLIVMKMMFAVASDALIIETVTTTADHKMASNIMHFDDDLSIFTHLYRVKIVILVLQHGTWMLSCYCMFSANRQ